jgi:hypothetical protein
MKFKLASANDGRIFVLLLDQGEEAFAAVTAFADEKAIKAASVAAIGAFESAEVDGLISRPNDTRRSRQ